MTGRIGCMAGSAESRAAAVGSEWPDYAELHCLSAFSFQRGAAQADELFARAAALGYRALAITDECSLAGIVRAHEAAERHAVRLIVGSELAIDAEGERSGCRLVLLVADLAGYQALCRLITLARRRAEKGGYRALPSDFDLVANLEKPRSTSEADTDHPGPAGSRADLHRGFSSSPGADGLAGLLGLWLPAADGSDPPPWLIERFAGRLWIAVELLRGPDDAAELARLTALGERLGLPRVASGDVHMHVRRRRALADTLTAIRHGLTLAEAGWRLFPNGERHLRHRRALAAIYPHDLLAETLSIAERCRFRLTELNYTYPRELVPDGESAASWLRRLTHDGAARRWPAGVPEAVQAQLDHELALIAELRFESYFLTVHDLVRYARSRGILCQGRGSAANSAVCYALGITEIDPARSKLLFERFISRERNEPPDIDIDFEHERREEVLQYVFGRYGRERAALTAVVTHYKSRSALTDVARAFGLPPEQIEALTSLADRWGEGLPGPEDLRQRGVDPDTPLMRQVLALASELTGFPRHLSQHPGGFVISEHPLWTLVPVENARMAERTVIQWDKDDLDTLGLMKVDCLALGMLTAIRKTLTLLEQSGRRRLTLATIPAEDPATYAMISRADTLGVFQIESRAQMAMLPRLKPRCFYDLVIEVAIVRPGPIQGQMVHPYLRRRRGEEPVDYPPALKGVFERTLGVPLFQEQVMQLAVEAAGYSPGEADQLRRSMAAWKRRGGLEPHRERLLAGMLARGYSRDWAEEIFEKIKGFGSYGFPESHAASFALLTYASCWLKCHEPAAFAASLINSQPLGFYTPDQILQDARRHGIVVRPVDVRSSAWDCTLEPGPSSSRGTQRRGDLGANPEPADPRTGPAIRLGFRLVSGFSEAAAQRLVHARAQAPFRDVDDLCRRARLNATDAALLADAGALKALAGHRHRAQWAVAGVERAPPLFAEVAPPPEAPLALPLPSTAEDLIADYRSTGLTLGPHPLALLRGRLRARRCLCSRALAGIADGQLVRYAGLVRMRQRPQTAGGVTFVTLEDEHGHVNAIVWPQVAAEHHRALADAQLLGVRGKIQRAEGVQHLILHTLEDWTELLGGLSTGSRDWH
jgi:error-prone DNA polymerase